MLALVSLSFGRQVREPTALFQTPILHTGKNLLLLSTGTVASRPEHGLFALLRSGGTGGALTRRLLPVVILLPLTLGALQTAGILSGLYSTVVGTAWFILAQMVIFAGIVLTAAASLDRMDAARRAAETELRSSERKYRLLFDASPQPMWVYDTETLAFLAVNDAAVEHYGYSREEFLSVALTDIRPPEEVPGLLQNFQELDQPRQQSGPWKHCKKDGTLIEVELHSSTLAVDSRPARLVLVRDRTVELRAERALAASEAQFRAIFELAAVGQAQVDPQTGRFLRVNAALCRMVGYSAAELAGMTISEITHPEDRERNLDQFRRMARGESPTYSTEKRYLHKDGSILWVQVEAALLWDEAGQPFRTTAVIQDITGRKEAEAALRHQQHLLRTVTDNAASALVLLDMEGHLTFHNPAFLRLTGYAPEEVEGKTAHELVHYRYSDGRPFPIEECPLDRSCWELKPVRGHEDIFIRKDGTSFPVVASVAPLERDGERVGGVIEFRDVTNEKEAVRALRASEERFRTIVETASEGIWLLDADGRISFVNPRMAELVGYTPAEMLGRHKWEFCLEEDAVAVRELFARRKTGISEHVDVRFRHRQGRAVWTLMAAGPLFGPDGQFQGAVDLFTDITERKRAEEALRVANTELREKTEQLEATSQQLWQTAKLATMGELAASIAHELNNPLGIVTLRVEGLLEDLDADAPYRRDMQVIEQEVDRMAGLVAHLLQFSRRSQPQTSTVDVREELDHTLELVRYHLRNRHIQVVRDYTPAVPKVQADRQQLRQLFLNLFTNASDAMPQGGTLTIRVATNGAVAVEVADTGTGIPAELLEKVREPFFTTKPEGQGTGLGLAICQRIMQEHHGAFTLTSREGLGTTVRLTFPK